MQPTPRLKSGGLAHCLALGAPLLMWHRCALGDVDPWHGLSILAPLSPELPALLVSGASHHAWTHPSLPTDQPSVVAARKAVRRQLAAWLGL